MKQSFFFIKACVGIFVATLAASASIMNVPDDYPTIRETIDASSDGDTVLVQPGTYVENIDFDGRNIVLGSLFLTTRDTSYKSATIIRSVNEDFVVKFENGEDSRAIISGFTIRNGPSEELPGGGIGCVEYSSPIIDHDIIWGYSDSIEGSGITCWEYSNPIISNNIIVDNQAHYTGGGISCAFYSNPVIINNIISDNSAGCGGGIYCRENSNPVIDNNIICRNVAYGRLPFYPYGGAIYCDGSSPEISNNIITRNVAYRYGSGIACEFNGNPVISNNTISENSAFCGGGIYSAACGPIILGNVICKNYASDWGGGVRCDVCNPTFRNNTIYGNSAVGGGGIHCYESSILIKNTILWADSASSADPEIYIDENSSASIIYCDIQGGREGEGNIDFEPLFRDPDDGDYHLMSVECGDRYDSPSIDAGHPAILDSLVDCWRGLGTVLSDMGPYGGGDSVQVGIDEIEAGMPNRFTLSRNYPNPFNGSTTIQYNLPMVSDVKIEIYGLLGRRVQILYNGIQTASRQRLIWDADSFASGVYFCTLTAGEFIQTQKMILVK